MLKGKEIFEKMNQYGSQRTPFFFLIDFKKTKGFVIPLTELNSEFQFSIENNSKKQDKIEFKLESFPISYELYEKQFQIVHQNILQGNSYLTNLTCETPIEINIDLQTIFQYTQAKYKLLWEGHFVCFSPETFVKIIDGEIFSYPMKGTIDAATPNAAQTILNDKKEMAEHYTIVDLIRNDLSKVAKKVTVTKFRYIDEIQTHDKTLLQVSSEIKGELPEDFHQNLGNIFDEMLPAGSICGAPKDKTVEIILEAESYDRNFYTGIFGVYDGQNLDSAVLIRFIEKTDKGLVFKSGGGITSLSDPQSEYEEMIHKIYVPIN